MTGLATWLQGCALATAAESQAAPTLTRGAMALFAVVGLILGLMLLMLVLITLARAIRRRRKPMPAYGKSGDAASADAWAEAGRRLSETGRSRD